MDKLTRIPAFPLITHDPSFDPLREEPRYIAVMEKLKNPKK